MPANQFNLTPTTLWALYCVLHCSHREMDELTGWGRDAIKNKVRAWNLDRLHEISINTHAVVRDVIRKAILALDPAARFDPLFDERADRVLARLTDRVVTGHLPLNEIERTLAKKSPAEWLFDSRFPEIVRRWSEAVSGAK